MSTPTPATATRQMEAITEPSRFDILCGHDKACYDNDGNGLYRSVIEKFSRQYAEALTRHDKTSVSFEVYSCLKRSTCRFLKYNKSIRGWEEMSSVAARDKICRALRFSNREKRKFPGYNSSSASCSVGGRSTISTHASTTTTPSEHSSHTKERGNMLQDFPKDAKPKAALATTFEPVQDNIQRQMTPQERRQSFDCPSSATLYEDRRSDNRYDSRSYKSFARNYLSDIIQQAKPSSTAWCHSPVSGERRCCARGNVDSEIGATFRPIQQDAICPTCCSSSVTTDSGNNRDDLDPVDSLFYEWTAITAWESSCSADKNSKKSTSPDNTAEPRSQEPLTDALALRSAVQRESPPRQEDDKGKFNSDFADQCFGC